MAPAARIKQLPARSEGMRDRNAQQFSHASAAIAKLGDENEILPSWRSQGWLNEHTVAIVGSGGTVAPGCRYQRVGRSLAALRRRAAVVDTIVMPTSFHAQVLTRAVMLRQQSLRRVHPAADQLEQGRTNVWMADAPAVDLAELAQWVANAV